MRDLIAASEPAKDAVARHEAWRLMREGTISLALHRTMLIGFWPLIERFPHFLALNLLKTRYGHDAGVNAARTWLARNLRTEAHHAEWYLDWAAALGRECPATPRVVLAHNPQSVESFGDLRADLTLSGHTHGGQIDWPGLGRILLGKKARRWAAGLYEHNDGHVYVNKGVGFGWRFRFGVRPEVAVFTLQPG